MDNGLTLQASPPPPGVVTGQTRPSPPATASSATSKLTPAQQNTLGRLREYLDKHVNDPAILPFALQLYSIAEHWYTKSGHQSTLMDDAFSHASHDVLTNPKYAGYHNSPLFMPNTMNLAVLGSEHLKDHILPALKRYLKDGTDKAMSEGSPFEAAFTQTARTLTREHELFLTESIPYGVRQLRARHLVGWMPAFNAYLMGDFSADGYAELIQQNARMARFTAAREVLDDYVKQGLATETQAGTLVHQTDLSPAGK